MIAPCPKAMKTLKDVWKDAYITQAVDRFALEICRQYIMNCGIVGPPFFYLVRLFILLYPVR